MTYQGLTNLGGFVGIVLAMLVTGPLNDWGVVWMSQRNRGIYEPEYRLIFMLGMLFGVFGYVGWAVGNDHHMPWIGAVACITYVLWHASLVHSIAYHRHSCTRGLTSISRSPPHRPSVPTQSRIPRGSMLNFSMVVSGGAAVTYLLDTHGADALHVLSVTNFAKNMVLYGSTFFANGVVVSRGVKASLLILGACQAVCWLASVPMYVYGKRVRSFVSFHVHAVSFRAPAGQ